MKREIVLQNKNVAYDFRQSKRARRMRLMVYCDGSVIVTAPISLREGAVEQFLREKAEWLLAKISFFKRFKIRPRPRYGRKDYFKYKDKAGKLANERVAHFNRLYGFTFQQINIKNQKTRWGSCSQKGNLNFNYKIALLPPRLADYVIVHELCHLRELNHSRKFWELVAVAISNHAQLRCQLKNVM